MRDEPGGRKYFETWFVECKHYKEGVPPEKLNTAWTWANTEKPDKLLYIASNFLSNQAKNWIADLKRLKPGFRIDYWERPDLENMASSKSNLLKKFNISYNFSLISIMHPSHVTYFRRRPVNTLDYLFQQLDELVPEIRQHLLYGVGQYIMPPNISDDDEDHLVFHYEIFKAHCHELVLSGAIDQRILIFTIVSYTLQSWLTLGDKTAIDETLVKHAKAIPTMKKAFEGIEPKEHDLAIMDHFYKRTGKSNENKTFADMYMDMFQSVFLDSLPERVNANHDLYVYFCEQVVEKLLLERYLYDRDK